jgi:RHS repeat-associated protein
MAYSYDEDDQNTNTVLADSAIWATSPYTYDDAALTRDANERIASTQAGVSSPISYGYNADSQLTTGISGTYTYDAAGRVTAQTASGTPPALAYDTDDELCATASSSPSCGSPGGSTTVLGYTTAGERCFSSVDPSTSDSCTSPPSTSGTTIDLWDEAGDLTCVSNQNAATNCASPGSSNTTTYSYNGAGLRIGEETHSTTYTFTWDSLPSTPKLLADGSFYYLYGPGSTPVEQIAEGSGTTTYLASDAQGVRFVINSDGTQNGTLAYDSYGNSASGSGSSFGYAGGYTDPDGLIYLINRYYDPNTGQFVSIDPAESVTGQPYGYVDEDPANEEDPNGLCVSLFGIACIGSGAVTSTVSFRFDPGAGANAAVNIGRGASFGLTDKIDNWISPGSSCAVPQNSADEFLGSLATSVTAGSYLGGGLRGAASDGVNPLDGTTYTQKVLEQMDQDIYHGFPSLVDTLPTAGDAAPLAGADGVTRTIVRLAGSINGVPGDYEWLIDEDSSINHRMFNPW